MDVQFLQGQLPLSDDPLETITNKKIPRLVINDHLLLTPTDVSKSCPHVFDTSCKPFHYSNLPLPPGLFYLHSSVVATTPSISSSNNNNNNNNMLVQLDLPLDTDAHLVLGLNNHHVGSYYWARSAGAGAAMEAPGVQLVTHHHGQSSISSTAALQWISDQGFTDCNSNDGKRSEWVPFLKAGDQVQLIPHDVKAAVDSLTVSNNYSTIIIYGVSNQGRPLGSEPIVVCQWKIEPYNDNGEEA